MNSAKNIYLRFITVLLLLSLVFTAACAEKAAEKPAGSSAATETQIETEPEISDGLPEADYEGYDFNILTRDSDHHTKEVYSLELNGEVVNDAVFARNRAAEERFNVKINRSRGKR